MLQVVVILVTWVIGILVLYMIFLLCLEPLLGKRRSGHAAHYQHQTNEEDMPVESGQYRWGVYEGNLGDQYFQYTTLETAKEDMLTESDQYTSPTERNWRMSTDDITGRLRTGQHDRSFDSTTIEVAQAEHHHDRPDNIITIQSPAEEL